MSATGIQLFVNDINSIVSIFKNPPLVSRRLCCECRRNIDGVLVENTEATFSYGDHEIFIANGYQTFIGIQDMKTMTCLNFKFHGRISLDESIAIAKNLIKKNKYLLRQY